LCAAARVCYNLAQRMTSDPRNVLYRPGLGWSFYARFYAWRFS
jgi:hypothetical protein